MKKFFCVFLCGVLLSISVLPAFANGVPEQRETLADGSYLVTSMDDDEPRHADVFEEDSFFALINRIIRFLRELFQKLTLTEIVTLSKYVDYYDSDDTLLWRVCLTASFTCSKQQATCTSASVQTVVYDEDWSVVSSDAEKAGNSATGRFTVQRNKPGEPQTTIERTITLTCDADGNVT